MTGLLLHLFVTDSAVDPLIPLLRTLAPTGRNLRRAKVDFPSLIWNKISTQKRHVIFFVFLRRNRFILTYQTAKNMRFIFLIMLFGYLFPVAAQDCDCPSNFQWLRTTFEENDAGFAYALERKGDEAYQQHNLIYEAKVKEIKIRPLDKVKIDDERTYWQGVNLILPIILLIIYGVLRFWWRRYKYARPSKTSEES